MKHYFSLIVLLTLIFTNQINGQVRRPVTSRGYNTQAVIPIETYIKNVKVLNVKDSTLIKLIDFHMNNINICSSYDLKSKYVYTMEIIYDVKDKDSFGIAMYFCSPLGLEEVPDIGMLRFNNSTYVIFGDAASLFFDKTDKKETISYDEYYVRRGEADEDGCIRLCKFMYPNDCCLWNFSYKNGKLTLSETAFTKHVSSTDR